RAVGVGARAHAVPRPEGVSRRGRAREGGPREHGLLAGGARAAPRPSGRGARGEPADAPEAPRPHDEVRAQARALGRAAARDPRAPEEGLRRPARPLVSRRAGAAPQGRVRARRDPPSRPLPAGRGRAPPRRACGGAARPPEEALHAPGLPALGLAVPPGVKRRLLDWLACPVCRGAIALRRAVPEADDIREGELACVACGARYPIERGIPRLVPPALADGARATAERFGYEWTRFAEIRPEYEAQMLGWIAPVGRDAFVGARVLDAGCGKGRHLRLAAAFGAKEVIGVDLGPAVDAAAQNTADLDNVHVVQGDLTHPPFRPERMDLIYSIGVLHHLPEPEAGFRALAPLLVPGGRFVAWVYAREGNGWVLALVDPAC